MYFCWLCVIPGTNQHLFCGAPFPLTETFSLSELNTSFSRRAANCTMFLRGYCSFPVFHLLPPHISLQLFCPSPLRSGARTRGMPYLSHRGCSCSRATHTSQFLCGRKITACTWVGLVACTKEGFVPPARWGGWSQASRHRRSARRSQLPGPHETHVAGLKVVVFHSVSV